MLRVAAAVAKTNKQTDLHIYIKKRSVVKIYLKRNLSAFSFSIYE